MEDFLKTRDFDIATQIICYTTSATCISAAIIGNIKLYRQRRSLFVQKRSPSVLFGLNLSLMFVMISIQIMYLCRVQVGYVQVHTSPTASVQSLTITVYHIISECCMVSGFLFVICFWLTKSWMLWFKEHWTYYTMEQQWHQLINANETNRLQSNWFLRNHYRFGNVRTMQRIFGVFHGIEVVVICIADGLRNFGYIDSTTLTVVMFVPILISVVFLVVIICKTTRLALYDDIMFIHWEATRLSRLCLLIPFLYILYSALMYLHDISVSDRVCIPFGILIIYAMHHTSTFSIFSKNIGLHRVKDRLELKDDVSPPSTPGQLISLTEVLEKEKSLHLFMEYLSLEYSMECLLSFIEFSQCEQLAAQYIDEVSGTDYEFVSFPANIPKSSIVSNIEHWACDDKELKLKMMAHKLYLKYIQEHSEFEINICSRLRKECRQILEDLDTLIENTEIQMIEIVQLIERARGDMEAYLRYSFDRFRTRKEWSRVEIVFHHSNHSTHSSQRS